MQSDPPRVEEAYEDADTMYINEDSHTSTDSGGGGGGGGGASGGDATGDAGGGGGGGSPTSTDGTPAVQIGALSLRKPDPDRPGMIIWGFSASVDGVDGEIRFRTTEAYSEEGARLAAQSILERYPERLRPVSGWG